uniref:Bromo domain-containing protein n=1 Tax=Ciona savignyi TaxID=51511 RepID=H2Z6H5_CIOSA
MYHYQRTSRRKTTRNRNYADLNNGVVEDEESDDETSESNEDEGDDSIHRRSSRLRMRKAAKREPQEDYVREKRATRKPRYMEEYQEDGSEDGEEEGSDAAEEEQGSNDEEDVSEDEDQSDAESDDYDEGSISRRIVDKLSSYKFAHLFREPVDPLIVPDYYEIITQPICLNDIRAKIDGKNPDVGFPLPRPTRNNTHPNYTFEILLEDVKLLADNAALYNAPDSYTSRQARKLEQSFVRLCKENFDSDEMIKRLGTLFKRAPKQ